MSKYKNLRYFKKNIINKYNKNKYQIKTFLKKKYKEEGNFFIKLNYSHYPIFPKKYIEFSKALNFNSYQNTFNFIKFKFFNIKYARLLSNIRSKTSKILYKLSKNPIFIKKMKMKIILNFIYNYNFFFNSIAIELFYYLKHKKYLKKNKIFYYLIISFKKNKIFINLKNFFKKTYLTLSTGLFIKFFEKKKSFKKNKTIKILMAKYIRKIFLITKIINSILIVKRVPKLLTEILNFFNSPIAHKFLNPVDDKPIEEINNNFLWIKFLYFIFIENKNFSKNKTPQKGRIKRKILRKITFENKIID